MQDILFLRKTTINLKSFITNITCPKCKKSNTKASIRCNNCKTSLIGSNKEDSLSFKCKECGIYKDKNKECLCNTSIQNPLSKSYKGSSNLSQVKQPKSKSNPLTLVAKWICTYCKKTNDRFESGCEFCRKTRPLKQEETQKDSNDHKAGAKRDSQRELQSIEPITNSKEIFLGKSDKAKRQASKPKVKVKTISFTRSKK